MAVTVSTRRVCIPEAVQFIAALDTTMSREHICNLSAAANFLILKPLLAFEEMMHGTNLVRFPPPPLIVINEAKITGKKKLSLRGKKITIEPPLVKNFVGKLSFNFILIWPFMGESSNVQCILWVCETFHMTRLVSRG